MREAIAFALSICVVAPQALLAQVVDEQQRREALKHYRAGQEFMYAEAWEKARAEFTSAVELDPLLALAHYGLGQSQMALKRYKDALAAFIACRDTYVKLSAMEQSYTAEVDRRREDELRELRDSLALIQSGRIKATTSGAHTAMKIEQRIKDLERVRGRERGTVSASPVPAEVFLALGSAYFRSGSLQDAEREYRQAIEINPKFGEAHNNLAVVYMMTGRYGQADEEVKAAEKAGFRVNPQFKEDLKKRASGSLQ